MTTPPVPDARQLRPYPYLERPLTAEDIATRRSALDAARQRRERRASWVFADMVLIFVGLGLVAVATRGMGAFTWFIGLIDILSVPLMVGIVTLISSAVPRYEADLGVVAEENEAELNWLLVRLPEGRALREFIAAQPRSYLVGELEALRTLWRERKVAAAAEADAQHTSSPEHHEST